MGSTHVPLHSRFGQVEPVVEVVPVLPVAELVGEPPVVEVVAVPPVPELTSEPLVELVVDDDPEYDPQETAPMPSDTAADPSASKLIFFIEISNLNRPRVCMDLGKGSGGQGFCEFVNVHGNVGGPWKNPLTGGRPR